MKRLAAVLVGGPPATGKSTLATALAPRLGAALLDLDVATGPLTRVVSGLIGVPDLDDPVLAGLTREACYDTLLGLAEANLQAGRPAGGSRRTVQYRTGPAVRLGHHRAATRGRPPPRCDPSSPTYPASPPRRCSRPDGNAGRHRGR